MVVGILSCRKTLIVYGCLQEFFLDILRKNHHLSACCRNKKLEEFSFYAVRLSNLVIAMAHKKINEKSDGPDPCFAVLGKPSHKSVRLGTNKDKNNPSANVTHVNMKETKYEENFTSSVKPTLFTLGSRKAAEIVQAVLNHFHSTLIVQTPGEDSLAHASVKTGSRTDAKAQMRSATTRSETLPTEKEMTCADAVGNHIIKQGFTLWHENQTRCIQYSKSQPRRELKQDKQRTCPGVQKFGGEDSSSTQFIGCLVDRVLKLCLMIVKYSNPDSILAESGSREDPAYQYIWYITPVYRFWFTTHFCCVSGFPQLQKLSSVAVEKGYKVGEILQAMLKYKKERQSGESVGNSVQLPVLNWLPSNS
ncbi:LOW QUALITY PROTEIN: A-kinase anchor protein 3 [Alca torda]